MTTCRLSFLAHLSAVSASKAITPTAAPGDTFKPLAILSADFLAAASN
jgi:hypothetical protein